MSADRIKEALRRWRAEGWTASNTGSNHWRLEHPKADGPVFVSGTTGDHRTVLNTEAIMRRKLRANAPPPVVAAVAVAQKPKVKPKLKPHTRPFDPPPQRRFAMGRFEFKYPDLSAPPSEETETSTLTTVDLRAWELAIMRLRAKGLEWSTLRAMKQRVRRDPQFRAEIRAALDAASPAEIRRLRLQHCFGATKTALLALGFAAEKTLSETARAVSGLDALRHQSEALLSRSLTQMQALQEAARPPAPVQTKPRIVFDPQVAPQPDLSADYLRGFEMLMIAELPPATGRRSAPLPDDEQPSLPDSLHRTVKLDFAFHWRPEYRPPAIRRHASR